MVFGFAKRANASINVNSADYTEHALNESEIQESARSAISTWVRAMSSTKTGEARRCAPVDVEEP
jgi:hypothetical protein